MHVGNTVLGGPIWLFALVVVVGTMALSVFTMVDAMRPLRVERFAKLRESRLLYIAGGTFYFGLAAIAQFARIPQLAAATVLATPFMIALGVAYLLRVVFPAARPE